MRLVDVRYNPFEKGTLLGFLQFALEGDHDGLPIKIEFKEWTVRRLPDRDGGSGTSLAVLPPQKPPKADDPNGTYKNYLFMTGEGWTKLKSEILEAAGLVSGSGGSRSSGGGSKPPVAAAAASAPVAPAAAPASAPRRPTRAQPWVPST